MWPSARDGAVSAQTSGFAEMTPAQLSMLWEGIDWRMPVRTWRPEMAGRGRCGPARARMRGRPASIWAMMPAWRWTSPHCLTTWMRCAPSWRRRRKRLRRFAHAAELAAKDSLIGSLRLQLARLRRMRFGRSSERLQGAIEQLELALEELEAEAAGAGPGAANNDSGADASSRPVSARAKPVRRPLPGPLPREAAEHPAPDACLAQIASRFRRACGGSLCPLGEDVTEVLDWVPGRFRVVRSGSCAMSGPNARAACARRSAKRRLCRSAAAAPAPGCSRTCWWGSVPTPCLCVARPRSQPQTLRVSAGPGRHGAEPVYPGGLGRPVRGVAAPAGGRAGPARFGRHCPARR